MRKRRPARHSGADTRGTPGGSGLTGPAVVSELISAGHTVTGLARSDASAGRLEALGAQVRRGDLGDLEVLRAAAEQSEGVLHMAFGGDFADLEDMARRDTAAITALGAGLVGSGKPLVMTSGTFLAGVYAIDAPASSARTRSLLGWNPSHPTLLEELEHGDYFDAPAPDPFAASSA